MGLRRFAGIGGLVFVGLVVIVNLAQGAADRPFGNPDDESYLADYTTYYTDADWIPTLVGVTVPFIWLGLAVFAVGLAVLLARGQWQSAAGGWALVGVLGVTMQNAIFPVVVAMDTAQFRIVGDGAPIEPALHEAHEVLFGLNSMSLAIALIGFSAAMLHSRLTARWLPRVGLAAGVLLAISVTNLGFDAAYELFDGVGLLGFVLWLVFIAGSSVWLLRQAVDAPTATATDTGTAATTAPATAGSAPANP